MKVLFAFVFGIVVASAFFYKVQRASEKPQVLQHNLNEEDFKEYLQLKNDKEKLAKAEEIFSKIIILMLYDLGLKVSKETQSAFQSSLQITADNKNIDAMAVNKVMQMPKAAIPALIPTKTQTPDLMDVESPSSSHAESFMKASQVDLNKVFPTSLQASASTLLEFLEGQFEGVIQPNDGSAEIRIELELRIQERSARPKGIYSLRLFKQGQLFSNSRGSGHLKDFRSLSGQTNIWIEEGGGDYRFQMFYFADTREWKANVYHKNPEDQWKWIGRTDLQKL